MDLFLEAVALVLPIAALAGMLAFAVERVTEKMVKPILARAGVKWLSAYAAWLLAALLIVLLNVDFVLPIVTALGLEPLAEWAGLVASVVIIGGGSNLLSDLWPGAAQALNEARQELPGNARRHLP